MYFEIPWFVVPEKIAQYCHAKGFTSCTTNKMRCFFAILQLKSFLIYFDVQLFCL